MSTDQHFATDWLIGYEHIDVDRICNLSRTLKCQISDLGIEIPDEGFLFVRFGLAVPSEYVFWHWLANIKCDPKRWFPISKDDFLKGRPIDLTAESRRLIWEKYNANLKLFDEAIEFYKALQTKWKTRKIYSVDWAFDPPHLVELSKNTNPDLVHVKKMYQTALDLDSLLGFSHIFSDKKVTHRLFLPLQSDNELKNFINHAAPHLPYELWSRVSTSQVPNLLRTHSWKLNVVSGFE